MNSRLDPKNKSFKLLIIDDDQQVLDTLCVYLTDTKYNVVSACDGLEGLRLLETEQQGFDLVITDLVLPKISGNYLILKIKKEFPDTPVIAITGWGAYPAEHAIEAQADRVLEKPFDFSQLDKTIKELLSA